MGAVDAKCRPGKWKRKTLSAWQKEVARQIEERQPAEQGSVEFGGDWESRLRVQGGG